MDRQTEGHSDGPKNKSLHSCKKNNEPVQLNISHPLATKRQAKYLTTVFYLTHD